MCEARSRISAIGLFLALFLGLTAAGANAQTPSSADEVFMLVAARPATSAVTITLSIAPGNYLYRDSLAVRRDGRELAFAKPPGEEKDDPNFGRVEIYRGTLKLDLSDIPASGRLKVAYQGCADRGICYPPAIKQVDLGTMEVSGARRDFADAPKVTARVPDANTVSSISESTNTTNGALFGGNTIVMIAGFFGFGLLLAFTPCMFPMIPILSGILAGQGTALSAGRGLTLSLVYVIAMASAYGFIGLVAGWTGYNVQFALQSPWALGAAAAAFVVLAFSMFGFYQLALPAGLAARLTGGPQRAGSLPGAAILGFGSALIVGPCVTPPLAAAMLYALQTGDAVRSGAALFALGLGMGAPLLLVGAFGSRVLPKSGPWLESAKQIFGVAFLAVALMLVSRMLPDSLGLALWGVFVLGAGVLAGAFDRLRPTSGWDAKLGKTTGLVASLYGAILIVGAAGGATDPLRPLGAFASRPVEVVASSRRDMRVTTLAELDKAVRSRSGRPAVVLFTADWCTICKSNDAVMAAPDLQQKLAGTSVIAADLTDYGVESRSLMNHFSIAGPPTLFLVDGMGREIAGSRLIGAFTAEDLSNRLSLAGL